MRDTLKILCKKLDAERPEDVLPEDEQDLLEAYLYENGWLAVSPDEREHETGKDYDARVDQHREAAERLFCEAMAEGTKESAIRYVEFLRATVMENYTQKLEYYLDGANNYKFLTESWFESANVLWEKEQL